MPSENSPRGPPCRLQWSGLCASTAKGWDLTLVEGLRLHKPYSVAKRKKDKENSPGTFKREVW